MTEPAPSPPQQTTPTRRTRWPLYVAPLVVLLLAAWGISTRVQARRELRQDTQRRESIAVVTAVPMQSAASQEIVLPGNIRAFMDAPIYARTNGYLRRWYADIGTHVRKGQLLADIETPEADQQLAQARADLASSQANANLAKTTAARYQGLLQSDSVSKQDTDNAVAAERAQSATVASAQANVARLAELQGFQKITAPFDGVITARNTDVGQLINSGAGSPQTELFHMADVKTLRVFVNLPQTDCADIKVGTTASVTVPEQPGRSFSGTLVRTADSIDPATRTLLVEVDVDNRDGQLLAGAYAEVHFKVRSPAPTLMVPVTALLYRSEGLRIAVVDTQNKAKLLPITLGRDYGTRVEVLTGLSAGDHFIDNPPDSLVDGQEVHVVRQETPGTVNKAANNKPGENKK